MTPEVLRLSRRLRALVWLGIIMLVALPGVTWLDPELATRWPDSRLEWSWGERALGWAIAAPPTLVVAAGLGQLLQFCRRVQEERVFTATAAQCIGRFGWSVIAAAVLLPVTRGILWFYVGAAPLATAAWGRLIFGQVALTAGVGLAIGFALLMFAGILREAARIADENAGFI